MPTLREPSASPTRILLRAGQSRVQTELVVGKLAPRLISRDGSSAHVGLTAAEMLLLDGDSVELCVEVGENCTLVLQDIGGTVAYPQRSGQSPGPPARWDVTIRLSENSALIWESLPFVVADSANVQRNTEIEMGNNARLLLRETLLMGRHGERGGFIRSRLNAGDHAGPILLEDLSADGSLPEPGILGSHSVVDSLIAIGFRPETRAGDLELEEEGVVARYLGNHTHLSPIQARFTRWLEALIRD